MIDVKYLIALVFKISGWKQVECSVITGGKSLLFNRNKHLLNLKCFYFWKSAMKNDWEIEGKETKNWIYPKWPVE